MPSGSYSKNRKEHHPPTLALDRPVLFDHSIKKELCPRPEPKSKKTNKQGWKQFVALCLGLLALPSLVFSAEPPHLLQRPQKRTVLVDSVKHESPVFTAKIAQNHTY
jgi:hypothetical protein